MIKEKYIILTIPLIFSAILLVTSTITASASINNYFKDEDDYENKFYREKYKEKIYHQDALCDDPQAVKKYGEVCKGYGNSFEDAKEECKDKGGEWNNGKCKFEDDEDEKDFEDEFEEEEEEDIEEKD
jgi:hypothetical protein